MSFIGLFFLPALIGGVVHSGTRGASAEECGDCHRAIYDSWKHSSHAHAMESRSFRDALALAAGESGVGIRQTCLGCHAPLAVQAGDLALERKASWEGVTCDYCHSVRDISMSGRNPRPVLQIGTVKTGPLKDAVSSAHQTAESRVHTSSLICMPCHEYQNAHGFQVLTTVSEWKKSTHAQQGKECQACHMGVVAGDVVDPRLRRTRAGKINLHEMPGSHSVMQLNRAVKVRTSNIRDGDQLQTTVFLTNVAAGHSLPTGSPMRELRLEVLADDDRGGHHRGERVYARRVADESGAPIEKEHLAFTAAAKQLSDTRLNAGETRQEVFRFPIPRGNRTKVEVKLWYCYSPSEQTKLHDRVSFMQLTQIVP